jgi:hypothetical protein
LATFMPVRSLIGVFSAGMVLLGAMAAAAQTAGPNHAAPPSAAELRAEADRVVANQHKDDQALDQYERVERTEERKTASDSSPSSVQVVRVFPVGTGNGRISLSVDGKSADAAVYLRDLRKIETALAWASQDGQKQRDAYAKFSRRRQDRADLLEATRQAYAVTWLGRESRNGRTLAKIRLDPLPSYKPTSRLTAILPKVQCIVWFDEATAHLVRFEGDILGDISFGGGIVAKVYKGGHFVMEQAEIAPGVWLPVFYQYDFDGRKFFFGFGVHQKTSVTGYRRVGAPPEAVQVVRTELNTLGGGHSDP